MPSETLSPILTSTSLTRPAQWRRHLHGRLVAFERDKGRFGIDNCVAGLDVNFDDGDALEVPNVWNLNVYKCHGD